MATEQTQAGTTITVTHNGEPLTYKGEPIRVPMDRQSILTWTKDGVVVRDGGPSDGE